jgi:hypothetical protein
MFGELVFRTKPALEVPTTASVGENWSDVPNIVEDGVGTWQKQI